MKLFKELGLNTALNNLDVRWDPTEWDEQTEQFKSYDAWANNAYVTDMNDKDFYINIKINFNFSNCIWSNDFNT